MKANELIGDEITSIEKEENKVNNFAQLQPIPLTTEILKKNGFVSMENNSGYVVVIGTIRIELRKGWPDENMAIWLNWDENNDGIYYADLILPYPEFVHELQHALQLCKINKEIEL